MEQLADAVIGPFEPASRLGEASVDNSPELMRAHYESKSSFELRLICPSRGFVPPPPLEDNSIWKPML